MLRFEFEAFGNIRLHSCKMATLYRSHSLKYKGWTNKKQDFETSSAANTSVVTGAVHVKQKQPQSSMSSL